jgi:methionine synthase II (cobalamin-independent)
VGAFSKAGCADKTGMAADIVAILRQELAELRDAGAELVYAAELINAVVAGFEDLRTGVHVCRGNWSKRDEVLLTGD